MFIEVMGLIRLIDFKFRGEDGREVDLTGRRARVLGITPDPNKPGNPDIRVGLLDADGKPTRAVTVKPHNVLDAPEKARIPRRPPAARGQDSTPGDEFGPGTAEWDLAPQLKVGRDDDGRRIAIPKTEADMADYPVTPTRQRDVEQLRLRRELATKARNVGDQEIARQLSETDTPDDWVAAIKQEQANRANVRAAEQVRRDALIADINAQARELSTDDPELRATQLDAILAKLRFSIIDTDKVHDQLYPPSDSGRWSAERNAEHEAMWNDLIADIEAAGIPKDHDAFVLGGLPGAGKTFTLKPGQKADRFGVVAWEPGQQIPDGVTHVSINPDIVKEMMIERGMLPDGIEGMKPMEQVTFLHEESSYIAKQFLQRLGADGYNVVLDNTMDSPGGMLKRMTPLARDGYTFRALFVDIPVEESLASARKRYIDAALSERGGRFVPSSVVGNRGSTRGNMSKNRDAFDELVAQDWFTEALAIDNTGVSHRQPKGEIVLDVTGDGSAAGAYLPENDAERQRQRGFDAPVAPLAPVAPPPTAPVVPVPAV